MAMALLRVRGWLATLLAFAVVACEVASAVDYAALDGAPCADGLTLCNGLCFDLTASPLHCGTCNRACNNFSSCIAGNCECIGTAQRCPNGCAELLFDSFNCGSCGRFCASTESCSGGACVSFGGGGCGGGDTLCPAGCVDLLVDGQNCGSCGVACSGVPCVNGRCSLRDAGSDAGDSAVADARDAGASD
jgi:hypothetical protein